MSSTPIQEYAVLNEVKFKLNIDTSDTSQDVQITVATNDANNYIAEQTVVHAAVIPAGTDPSLSSMANNLAAAYFNFWISTEKDREELERWQNRIQQFIMAKYGKKSANLLSGEETFGFTTGFSSITNGGGTGNLISPLTTKGDIWGFDTSNARIPVGATGFVLTADSSNALGVSWQAVSGTGDVVGPGSSTDNAIARYDETTGNLIQNSGVIIDDSDNVTGVLSIEIGNATWTISEDGSDELLFTSPTGDGDHGIKIVSDTGEILLQNTVSTNDYTSILSTGFTDASSSTTAIAFSIQSNITTASDAGTEPITQIQGKANGSTVGTRPIIGFYNFNTKLWEIDNDGTVDMQGNTLTNAVLESILTDGSIFVGDQNNASTEIPAGLETKEDCRVATTANIDLSSPTDPNPVDGVTLSTNERILLKNQTDAFENGIYDTDISGTNPTNWNRADDADTSVEVNNGMLTVITEGTTNANTAFVLTTPNPITLNTTDLTFQKFSFADLANLNSAQRFIGIKTFGEVGDVGKLAIAGTTSGITILDATPVASGTLTLPAATDILVARDTVDTLTFKTIDANNNTLSNLVIGVQVTGASTALTDTADIAYLNTANTYTAGTRQDFLGLLGGTSGLNVGGIAGNPTTQVNGDIWLNTTSNTLFGRINGIDVDLGASGGGITSINSDTASVQTLTGGDGIDIIDSTPDHSFAVDVTVARDTDNLSFFATTTSTQLAGIISDETGTGALVFANTPTLVTPFIGNFTSATHDHSNPANGAVLLSTTALSDTADIAYLNTANTWSTGIQSFVAASNLRIPVSATPTIAVDGDIAYDTTVTGFSTGLIKFFGTEEQGLVAMPIAQFTSPTNGHIVTYNATSDSFELVAAGAGTGDVVGPASSTTNSIATFFDTTGKEIQDTQITIGATANMANIQSLVFVTGTSPGSGTTHIALVSNDFHINTTGANFVDIRIDGTEEYKFNSSQADFKENDLIMESSFIQLTSIADPGGTGADTVGKLYIDGDNSNHLSIQRNSIVFDLESINFPINFPEQAATSAISPQEINFSGNTRHAQKYTLTENTTFTFAGTTTDTTEYIDLLLVQDATGGHTIDFGSAVNAAVVEAGLDQTALAETSILVKFHYGTFYVFLQGSNPEVFTWSANHSMATFKLTADAVNDVILNAPTSQGVSIEVAASQEYLFSATQADFNGNNILNAPQILDSNGNELVIFTTTASAVNELTLVNAATANAVQLQATGGDTNVDVRFVPKGTGTFYGNRETWAWPLIDETTAPTVAVHYTTAPAPYDMTIEDAIGGLTIAGTGVALFTLDVLKEDSLNANTFTTIFSVKITIDASEFTSTTAATAPVINVSTWEKGRRLQLSVTQLDTGTVAIGPKIELITHATAK